MNNIYTDAQCDKIAKNVLYLSAKRGMNLKQLSEKTGISITTLSLFVNRYKNLKVCNLQKVAEVLGVEIKDLANKQY